MIAGLRFLLMKQWLNNVSICVNLGGRVDECNRPGGAVSSIDRHLTQTLNTVVSKRRVETRLTIG